jgi:hypothetical protein
MTFWICPTTPGQPGHRTRDPVIALAWAERHAARFRSCFVIFGVERGRPRRLAEVRPPPGC